MTKRLRSLNRKHPPSRDEKMSQRKKDEGIGRYGSIKYMQTYGRYFFADKSFREKIYLYIGTQNYAMYLLSP
jgi:hypothetical protein